MDLKIHVAFGFHVNLYHSYRGDTPDEKGFGSDLRIIRGILRDLDALNAEGIPVRGTWDSDNVFSLGKILPAYAPDILASMKRRVEENGDEHILMGWSNGALGAMTKEELSASIRLAETNPEGSGVIDLFGKCRRIVRPQEMMFTPSQAKTYADLGVEALCLYRSAVPFDAFATLIPPPGDEKAFNPMDFSYDGAVIRILPTVSNADVCDAGCLRALVKDLRRKQEAGEITHDLCIFINMDADAIFWESLSLPGPLKNLANTDGIRGLVREVADLPYVVFSTPGTYLDAHESLSTLFFGQDTADGNFTGIASWAEKPANRAFFTPVCRARRQSLIENGEEAFLTRVRLLSTTHFGLASPVLNIERERAARALVDRLTALTTFPEGELRVLNPARKNLLFTELRLTDPRKDVSSLRLEADGLSAFAAIRLGDDALGVWLYFAEPKPVSVLGVSFGDPPEARGLATRLVSGNSALDFSVLGTPPVLRVNGQALVSPLYEAYITYGGKKYPFSPATLRPLPIVGGTGVRLAGEIHLPGEVRPGRYVYDFFTLPFVEGFFTARDVTYPHTPEGDAVSTENSTLGRYTDFAWEEAVPFALTPALTGDTQVVKRNFENAVTAFRLRSFGEAIPENADLDSMNHQFTNGFVGLTGGNAGLYYYNASLVSSSMAFCPMRLKNGQATMNPFGTFAGRQRKHPSRSNGIVPATYSLIAPQSRSLAPAYNGVREVTLGCLQPVSPGQAPDENLLSFADGAPAAGKNAEVIPFAGDNVTLPTPDGREVKKRMRSPLATGIKGNLTKYAVWGVRALRFIVSRQRGAKG